MKMHRRDANKSKERDVIVVRPADFDATTCPAHCDIRQSLSPALVLLKLFGLYHDASGGGSNAISPIPETAGGSAKDLQDFDTQTHCTSDRPGNCRWPCPAQRCYSLFVAGVLFVHTVKFVYAMTIVDSVSLGFRIVIVNWYVQNLTSSLCLLVSCWKRNHFRAFYKQWTELFCDPVTRDLGFEPTNCSKAIMAITAVGVLLMLINITGLSITSFYDKVSIMDAMQHVLTDPLPPTAWSLTLAMVIHVFNTGAWIYTNTFVVSTVHLLAAHFSRLAEVLKSHIAKSECHIPSKIKEIRTCHLRLCQLLSIFNNFLKIFLAVTYLATIVGCCFILYQLIFYQLDTMSFALNIFWLLTNALSVLALSISLSRVHEAAHEPLEDLFTLETSDSTDVSQVLQVQLFLTKLTGTTIGASVLDLFTITKEALLTIAGAYLTYFLLLIQFNI